MALQNCGNSFVFSLFLSHRKDDAYVSRIIRFTLLAPEIIIKDSIKTCVLHVGFATISFIFHEFIFFVLLDFKNTCSILRVNKKRLEL